MPADFTKCQKEGGRIRTKKTSRTGYIHICYDKAGKSHAGEPKTLTKKK